MEISIQTIPKRINGRKKFTPVERVYFNRVEFIILLGIYLAERQSGGNIDAAVKTLFEKIHIENSIQTLKYYKLHFYIVNRVFRSVIKDRAGLTPVEHFYMGRVESAVLLGAFIAEDKNGGTIDSAIHLMLDTMNIESNIQTVKHYKQHFYAVYEEFRGIIKTA